MRRRRFEGKASSPGKKPGPFCFTCTITIFLTLCHCVIARDYDQDYFSDSLVSDYTAYAECQIKHNPNHTQLWNWLEQVPAIKQGLLAAMYPGFHPEVLACLDRLYRHDETHVEQYPHLALAFSLVYGAANGQDFRPDYLQWWVSQNRDVPALEDSFEFYIQHRDKMLYSLNTFSWPLLLYVVDNDIPLDERDWVLDHYAGESLDNLDGIYGHIKHNGGAEAYTRAQSQAPGVPMALNQIFADGGVCSQQAYYSSRVFKSFGVPSVRLLQPGHSFMTWVCGGTRLRTNYGGDHSSRKNEFFFNPNKRIDQKGYEFQMLVSAINLSSERYLKSEIAAIVFDTLPGDSKKQAQALLDLAIEKNRYVAHVWLLYAKACREGLFPQETGLALYAKAEALLPEYPELLCIILNEVSSAHINEALKKEIPIQFRNTLAHLRTANRPDLAYDVFITHFDFLVKTEGVDEAVGKTSAWLRFKNLDVYFQEKLFDHIRTFINKTAPETREKWLSSEYQRCTVQFKASQEDRDYHYFSKVASACIDHYKKTGNTRRVSKINSDIALFRGDIFNEKSFDSLVENGTVLGATEQAVTQLSSSHEACYAWQILYDIPKGYTVTLQANHSDTGKQGAFCFTAWSDTNRDGLPDTRIDTSSLKTATQKEEWSDWQFVSDGNSLFVGITTKTTISLFYQNRGELTGYRGLSSRMFYSRKFDSPPENSVEPRYINLRVTITKEKNGRSS